MADILAASVTSSYDATLPQESLLLSRARTLEGHQNSGKIDNAARDFESILLTQWLEQAREAFAGVPGGDEEDGDDPGHSQLQSLGMQALATAITKSGGIGIATVISRHLRKQEVQASQAVEPDRQSLRGSTGACNRGAPSHQEKSEKRTNQIAPQCR